MAPPVRFFERLMPAASPVGARVHAALPSRFAPPALELGPRESLVQDDGADTGAASRDQDIVPRRHAVAPDIEQHAAPTSAPRTERVVVREGPVVDARALQVSVIAPPNRPNVVDMTPREPSTAEVPTRERTTAADVVPRQRGKAAAHEAPAVVRARPATPAPAATVPDHAPLRDQVRERRIGPPSVPPPTIVHVTIDRIDVRAPAASAPPDRAVSKPRNDSWKSLGDYLRQRERGGAS